MSLRPPAALFLLLLAAPAATAGVDPTGASQRDFVLRHYFMGPSETAGWAADAPLHPLASEGRVLGPFRPAYFTHEGERRRGDRTAAQLAALDLEVKPRRALVLVGGRPVGRAALFDGLPRWLWLEPGRSELAFVTPDGSVVRKTFELSAGSVTNLSAVLD